MMNKSTSDMEIDELEHRKGRGGCRKLYGLLAVLSLLSLGLLIAVIVLAVRDTGGGESTSSPPDVTTAESPGSEVCVTAGCIRAAADLLDIVNKEVQPCDNFYEFACGNWHLKSVIPEDASSYGTFSKVRHNLRIGLKGIMESGNPDDFNFSDSTRWAKRVFDDCMNSTAKEEAGISPFREVLESVGGWSLGAEAEGEAEAEVTWEEVAGKVRAYGPSYVMSVYVSTDRLNVSRRVIYVDQPSLALPAREDYFPGKAQVEHCVDVTTANSPAAEHESGADGLPSGGGDNNENSDVPQLCTMIDDPSDNRPEEEVFWQDARINAYKTYVTILATMKLQTDESPEINTTMLEYQIERIIRLEQKIANATVPMSERRNATAMYNKMTIKDLRDTYPNIAWDTYFSTVFGILPDGERPDDNTEVVVRQKEYFEDLNSLLGDAQDAIHDRDLKNYVLVRAFMHTAHHLNARAREARLDFRRVLYGVTADEAMWKQCLSLLNDQLGMAVGKLYVDIFFDQDAKQTALDMINDVVDAFDALVDNLEWMDDETKALTKEKAEAITPSIAYPDVINDPELLDKLYDGLNMSSPGEARNHADNVIKLWRFSSQADLKILHEPVDKSEWFTSPAVVNAYHSPTQNGITFPAGILQPPFFAHDALKALNYGAIGVVMGHEITHGFDDQGRQTDKDGNLNQWWSETVIDNFVEQAQCIVDQYGNYSEQVLGETLHLNGINTQGENIADNGGVKQAFKAYEAWVSQNGQEQKLPGFEDYTSEQLFFINYANVWCGLNREEYLRVRILTGVHSPGKYRIIGPLSNSEEFSRAFNCTSGSYMNPEKKCSVW